MHVLHPSIFLSPDLLDSGYPSTMLSFFLSCCWRSAGLDIYPSPHSHLASILFCSQSCRHVCMYFSDQSSSMAMGWRSSIVRLTWLTIERMRLKWVLMSIMIDHDMSTSTIRRRILSDKTGTQASQAYVVDFDEYWLTTWRRTLTCASCGPAASIDWMNFGC